MTTVNPSIIRAAVATAVFLLGICYSPATSAAEAENAGGIIRGQAIDRESGEPLAFTYLHLEELNRSLTAHTDGTFEFRNVPEGRYTLSASRIGYQSVTTEVDVQEGDTTVVQLSLRASVLSGENIEILGNRERQGANLEHASKTVSGAELRRGLTTTLASTLEDIPGFGARKMGAAPARPVIRGLGGERLLILQDGERTGDVSSQSADHAVTVDPMAAEKIEIARGPASLQYGANAIGGVINVVRNQIPTTHPDHLHGTASLQGVSVSSGVVAALEAGAPLSNSLAIKFDGNLRSARNIHTPGGTLENSGILSTNNAIGLSYIQPWGYAGLASSIYLNNYGIPPDPDGGHENGVDIEMQKFQVEGRTEISLPSSSAFHTLSANLSHKNYYHRELESGGAVGTEYGVLTNNLSLSVGHGEYGILTSGTLGIWGEYKNYAVDGTQTPDSESYNLAGFWIENLDVGPLHLEAGLRFDLVNTLPAEEELSDIGAIRKRDFSALSGSAAAIYNLGEGFYAGTTFLHSFRAPSQEELYSEGPHLASYSYEIGNPDLKAERGLGKELFLRYRTTAAKAELTLFHSDFSNYIYPRDTGRPSPQFPTLNLYQFTGVEAIFQGFEFSSELKLFNNWAISGGLHYTHARRMLTEQEQQSASGDRWEPLPMIPPLKGSLGLTYAQNKLQLGAKGRFAAEQNRTGEFEAATDGYAVFDLFAQYRIQRGGLLHTFSLRSENIFDTSYRNHLSRIKELLPEPGRSISLLYRMYF